MEQKIIGVLDILGIPYEVVLGGILVEDKYDGLMKFIIDTIENEEPEATNGEMVLEEMIELTPAILNSDFAIVTLCKRRNPEDLDGLLAVTTSVIGDMSGNELARVNLTVSQTLYEQMINRRYGMTSIQESHDVAKEVLSK